MMKKHLKQLIKAWYEYITEHPDFAKSAMYAFPSHTRICIQVEKEFVTHNHFPQKRWSMKTILALAVAAAEMRLLNWSWAHSMTSWISPKLVQTSLLCQRPEVLIIVYLGDFYSLTDCPGPMITREDTESVGMQDTCDITEIVKSSSKCGISSISSSATPVLDFLKKLRQPAMRSMPTVLHIGAIMPWSRTKSFARQNLWTRCLSGLSMPILRQ